MILTIATDSDAVLTIRRVPNGYILTRHQVIPSLPPQVVTQELIAETVEQVCTHVRHAFGDEDAVPVSDVRVE